MRTLVRIVKDNYPLLILGNADYYPHMVQTMHDRIQQRLTDLGLTAEAVSKEAGFSRDYLRKLFERPGSTPRLINLEPLARALQVSSSWLLTGTENDASPNIIQFEPVKTPQTQAEPAKSSISVDIPVMGTAAASHDKGAFQFDGGPVDYVMRPPALSGARNVYALYVSGDSMWPRYEQGELIFVHPDRPARNGDAVVIQRKTDEHMPMDAILGTLRKISGGVIRIQKLNPVAEIEFDEDEVVTMHKVLTTNDLFGV